MFRQGLSRELFEQGIRGHMWHNLRERFNRIAVRVLHPGIFASSFVSINHDLPEGSRLCPILFGIVAADLIRAFQREFPKVHIRTDSNPGAPPGASSSLYLGWWFLLCGRSRPQFHGPGRTPSYDYLCATLERTFPPADS